MLFTGGFDDRAEVDQLMALLIVHEIGEALRPSVFEFNQDLDKLVVILKLRIDYLDVLFVLLQ